MSEVTSLESAQEREAAIQKNLQEIAARAISIMSSGMLAPVGYRLLIKPITIKRALEGVEADMAPTLAAKGFEARTDSEAKRQERGENHGIVVALGPAAYARMGGEPWVKVGDVVLHTRYAGSEVEHPPGSKQMFRFINDDDVMGVIV